MWWIIEKLLGTGNTTQQSHPSSCMGLVQVYPDPSSPQEDTMPPQILENDIIAIHGLNARSPDTWLAWKEESDPNSGNVNWLSDRHMLPHFMPNSRILTYDWNASPYECSSSSKFLGQAETFLDAIYRNRKDTGRLDKPIIFIASCFGGLLLAKALCRASGIAYARHGKYNPILNLTIGAIFLGTPFRGSGKEGHSAADVRIAIAVESDREYSRELVEYLKPGTQERPSPLDELVQQFGEMINNAKFRFKITCAYETRHTNVSAYTDKLPKSYRTKIINATGHAIVVTEVSACLDGPDRLPLSVRHNMMHKYNSPDDQNFRSIVSRLEEFVEEANDTLSKKGKT